MFLKIFLALLLVSQCWCKDATSVPANTSNEKSVDHLKGDESRSYTANSEYTIDHSLSSGQQPNYPPPSSDAAYQTVQQQQYPGDAVVKTVPSTPAYQPPPPPPPPPQVSQHSEPEYGAKLNNYGGNGDNYEPQQRVTGQSDNYATQQPDYQADTYNNQPRQASYDQVKNVEHDNYQQNYNGNNNNQKSLPSPVAADYGGFRPVIKKPYQPQQEQQYRQQGYQQAQYQPNDYQEYQQPKQVSQYQNNENVYIQNQHAEYQQRPQLLNNVGYGLDYAQGKPYGGDLSKKPYSVDAHGHVNKIIPMSSYQSENQGKLQLPYGQSDFSLEGGYEPSGYEQRPNRYRRPTVSPSGSQQYGESGEYLPAGAYDNVDMSALYPNSMSDESYLNSMFGYPINSGLYAAASQPFGATIGGKQISVGRPSIGGFSSFFPSLKLTDSGLRLSAFGQTIGLPVSGNFNNAIQASLGMNQPAVGGVSNSPLAVQTIGGGSKNPFRSGFYSSLIAGPGNNGLRLPGSYTAATKLIPQVIRAPFKWVNRALSGAST